MAKYRNGHGYHPRFKPVHDYMVSTHPLYAVWCNMIDRCCNPDTTGYENYGGRGISVCDEWRNSFETFASDMGIPPQPKCSIDRADNDGNYEPTNCRWATRSEQMKNRRKFKTNTTGEVGVVAVSGGRFAARFDDNGVRYGLGRFSTAGEAATFRKKFIAEFSKDKSAALAGLERRARFDSATGIRGITKHSDGYMVRKTIKGERVYLGFSKTFEGAVELWNASK